jgi:hypothetical protein
MTYRILYSGSLVAGRTSLYRYRALERLNQDMVPFDLMKYPSRLQILNTLRNRLPIGPLISRLNADLLALVRREEPDVVWLDKPIYFTSATIRRVKESRALTVCYCLDNPFGPRNDGCWYQFYRTYRLFDLHCLIRNVDISRYREWGLNYVKTQLSYDPIEHFPPPSIWCDSDRDREVSYVGSPYEDRPNFLRTLIEKYKLPITISGPRWRNFFNRREYELYVRGGMLIDSEYREAIWKSKINLSFLTHLNEEDVSHKAFEIAACGGFLLALRCAGHQACFEEGKEAEFFSSIEECADKIRYYLAHPAERERIAQSGYERAIHSGYDNDTQLAKVLERIPVLPSRNVTSATPSF